MALPKTIETREYFAFKECNGNPAKRVSVCQGDGETIKVEFDEAGESINQYTEALGVAASATATVLTYTVPALKEFKLKTISYSGTNRGEYLVEVSSSTIAKQRTYYINYNGVFQFADIPLVAGDIIKLIVENKSTTMTGDFNGNLQGKLQDA